MWMPVQWYCQRQWDFPKRREAARSGRTKWSTPCAEISGKSRGSKRLIFKSYFHLEKLPYEIHNRCVSCLTFKEQQRKLVRFTAGWGEKGVSNCRTWKFRFRSKDQIGSFSFHHCSEVVQANESRPDHSVWCAFWMEPSPRSHSGAGFSTEAVVKRSHGWYPGEFRSEQAFYHCPSMELKFHLIVLQSDHKSSCPMRSAE